MPGVIDILGNEIKKQKGFEYRLVRLDADNVVQKKVRGYSFVKREDPEIKGTILEEHMGADRIVRVGNLAIAKISTANAEKHRATIQGRKDRKLRALKRGYQAEGEKIKRQMGKHHKDFKIIHEVED